MAEHFNVVVIGAGAAGLVSAYISAMLKARVALIERTHMGGDCLNYGCVPSKALIRTARLVHDMRRASTLGVKSASFELDFAQVMDRVHAIIKSIEPNDSVERYTGLGVECFQGDAQIVDPHTVQVGDQQLRAKVIILAMGASPIVPPIKGLETVPYKVSENLWQMRELPKRLVVLGGGPIGCEMTQAFARLGSQVTQIDMGPRLLPREDEDVAGLIAERFAAEGVTVRTHAKAEEVTTEDGTHYLTCDVQGTKERFAFDELLIAVGRRANTAGMDLDRLGIALNANGTVQVDPYLRTPAYRHIFACGDVAGPFQFTHTAAHQAWYCAVNGLLAPWVKFRANYAVVPWCTFTDPEVAQVGLNETEAQRRGVAYEVTRYDLDDLDRAKCESEAFGMVKVLTKPGKDTILGATVVGHYAGEWVTEFVSAMKHGFGLNAILGTVHAYPTFAEGNKYAAGNWKKAHKPEWALPYLERYFRWRRG